MKDLDDSKAPLFDHLVELRKRLLICLAVLVVAFFAAYAFAQPIFGFLVQPLKDAGETKVIYTDVFEAFWVQVKVALFAALMVCFPVIATQIWRFVAPGLYAREKKAVLPFLLLTPVFFGGGAAFAYYLAMPWALHFLLGFQGQVGGIDQEALPSVGLYLSFVTRFLFGFGVAFLLPILLMLLERAGLVTREQLTAKRRYAIVGAFAVAAVLTPPDAISQFMLAVPLWLLYESSIIAIRLTHWRAARKRKVEEPPKVEEPLAQGGPEIVTGGGRVDDLGPV